MIWWELIHFNIAMGGFIKVWCINRFISISTYSFFIVKINSSINTIYGLILLPYSTITCKSDLCLFLKFVLYINRSTMTEYYMKGIVSTSNIWMNMVLRCWSWHTTPVAAYTFLLQLFLCHSNTGNVQQANEKLSMCLLISYFFY